MFFFRYAGFLLLLSRRSLKSMPAPDLPCKLAFARDAFLFVALMMLCAPPDAGDGRSGGMAGKTKRPNRFLILRSRLPCNKGCLSQSCRPDAASIAMLLGVRQGTVLEFLQSWKTAVCRIRLPVFPAREPLCRVFQRMAAVPPGRKRNPGHSLDRRTGCWD